MNNETILLGHGSGGRLTHRLIEEIIYPAFGSSALQPNDAAILEPLNGKLAFTTDSYIVDPMFFPGGDIGKLAVHGTVNDLSMMGAIPKFLTVGMIIEEGIDKTLLASVVRSMAKAAKDACVEIVAGDTKVVPRGKGDKIFINTSGLGEIRHPYKIDGSQAKAGDKVIVSGSIGDHGVTVMAARESLSLKAEIASDTAPLNVMVQALLEKTGDAVHVLRDPTRGGVATTIKEIALQSAVDIMLYEEAIPVKPAVSGVCAILGLDPLFVANEGKLLLVLSADKAEYALNIIKSCRYGEDASIIGEVSGGNGKVRMKSRTGGVRLVDMLSGEQLPRIC